MVSLLIDLLGGRVNPQGILSSWLVFLKLRCWYNWLAEMQTVGGGDAPERSEPAAAPSSLLELGQACADHHTLRYEIQTHP